MCTARLAYCPHGAGRRLPLDLTVQPDQGPQDDPKQTNGTYGPDSVAAANAEADFAPAAMRR
jgi:hypothetical protein